MLCFRRLTLFSLTAAAVASARFPPRPGQAQGPVPGQCGGPREERELKIAAPDFPDHQKWLNSKPLTLQQLRGKVVLVDFWEYTCVNCIRTFPYLKSWNEKYKD